MTDLHKDFQKAQLSTLPYSVRRLINSATEIHVKHGLVRGNESSGKEKLIREGVEWERFRSALLECRDEGFVGEEWSLEET